MTQTAGAFGHVANALTFFVNYYTYLAGFKSVVDRLNSFDAAIDQAEALSDAGPKRVASAGSAPRIDFEDLELFLPDGRCAATMAAIAPTTAAKSVVREVERLHHSRHKNFRSQLRALNDCVAEPDSLFIASN
jgi:hypothetical protein